METRIPGATQNLWDPQRAVGLSELEALAYRSNLLGSDRAVANYGGGNTSTKARESDHTGREIDVLWVKGSGATSRPYGPSSSPASSSTRFCRSRSARR